MPDGRRQHRQPIQGVAEPLEEESPGTKANFLFGFLERAAAVFQAAEPPELTACQECGQATTGRVCAFCRLRRPDPRPHRSEGRHVAEPFREGRWRSSSTARSATTWSVSTPPGRSSTTGGAPHSEIIGASEGVRLQSSGGGDLMVLRPRLADYILKMQRGPRSSTPRTSDRSWCGATSGRGCGARGRHRVGGAHVRAGAGRRSRRVGVTVERREDHQKQAIKTLTRWFGEVPVNLDLRIGEVEEVVAEVEAIGSCLDLPSRGTWPEVAAESQPGGIGLVSYLPTVPQVQQLVDVMRDTDAYAEIDVFETLHRTWNVKGRSVRPDHQMVGHTGFVVTARRVVAYPGFLTDRRWSPAHGSGSAGSAVTPQGGQQRGG
jgi:tRNA (adenine57-N1/adenine58-N1)-methyltransferase catalytic subunit